MLTDLLSGSTATSNYRTVLPIGFHLLLAKLPFQVQPNNAGLLSQQYLLVLMPYQKDLSPPTQQRNTENVSHSTVLLWCSKKTTNICLSTLNWTMLSLPQTFCFQKKTLNFGPMFPVVIAVVKPYWWVLHIIFCFDKSLSAMAEKMVDKWGVAHGDRGLRHVKSNRNGQMWFSELMKSSHLLQQKQELG